MLDLGANSCGRGAHHRRLLRAPPAADFGLLLFRVRATHVSASPPHIRAFPPSWNNYEEDGAGLLVLRSVLRLQR